MKISTAITLALAAMVVYWLYKVAPTIIDALATSAHSHRGDD